MQEKFLWKCFPFSNSMFRCLNHVTRLHYFCTPWVHFLTWFSPLWLYSIYIQLITDEAKSIKSKARVGETNTASQKANSINKKLNYFYQLNIHIKMIRNTLKTKQDLS